MNLPFRKPNQAASQPFVIPRLDEVSELYASLQAKGREISAERGRLEAQRQTLITRLRESHGANPRAGRRASTEQEKRVAEILGEADAPASHAVTLREEIATIDKRLDDLGAANSVLRERLEAERLKASAIICREVEPQYRALMAEIADRMCELAHAAIRYREFSTQLNAQEIAWARFDPMSHDVGGAALQASPFRAWLGRAIEQGFAERSQLPECLR